MNRFLQVSGTVLLGAILGAIINGLLANGGKGVTPPSDSPVVVRGGSMKFLIQDGSTWAPVLGATDVWSVTQSKPLTALSIDGIVPSGSGTYGTSSVGITDISTNWIITVDFRESDGKTEDKKTVAQICTNWIPGVGPGTGCVITGKPGKKLFLVGNLDDTLSPKPPMGNQKTPTFSDDSLSDAPRKTYDVYCNGVTTPDSNCDHIFTVKVSALTGIVSPGTTPTGWPAHPYQCVNGACDIGVGKP
jgi:hypothetical protein